MFAVVGGVTDELAAQVIRKTFYGDKNDNELTEAEKQNISALAQLATGLAIAVAGGDVGDAGTAIAAGKNAVENNALSPSEGGNWGDFAGIHYDTGAQYDAILDAYANGYLTDEQTIQVIDDLNKGKYMYDPVREDIQRLPEDILIMVTPYGDYIAFRDAESWGDYSIAVAGILPFGKIIKIGGKVVKIETKAGQALVKEAEKAYHSGDIATGNQLMNQAASHGTTVETTVVRNSGTNKGTTNTAQAGNAATKPSTNAAGTIPTVDQLSQAAASANRNGLTDAGRALQKHGGREGSVYTYSSQKSSVLNKEAQNIVDDILSTPGTKIETRIITENKQRIKVIEATAPDGRAIRFNENGTKLIGFREP